MMTKESLAMAERPRRFRSYRTLSFPLLVFLLLFPAPEAHGQEAIPIHLERLSDRVLVTWACDYFQGTNMAVIATDGGLVVIDTGLSSSTVRRQRARVEEELGRSDFRYLINTHMHNDHVFANEVFPEATVVSPTVSVDALRQEIERIPELLDRLRASQESYNEWAREPSLDSAEAKQAREGVAAFSVGIADLEKGFEPRYPTTTFDGHHTMHVGGLRLELFQFPGLHSDSDILILVPEQRLLFTGDVFWGGRLPVLRTESRGEFRRLLDYWKEILDMSPDLEVVVPGHSDVPLTVEQFQAMYAYLERLWADVRDARAADKPLLRFMVETNFREKYPEVADFTFVQQDYNLHQHNVYVLWGFAGE